MSEGHAILAPSGSYRRIKCPGSLLKEQAFPNDSTTYAEEGSSAHALGEKCIKAGLTEVPDEFLGRDHRDKKDIKIEHPATDEMAAAVEVYLEEVAQLAKECGHVYEPGRVSSGIQVELRVQMMGLHPEFAWGTLDLGMFWPEKKRAIIRDYKHGKSIVDVEIEDDDDGILYITQLMEYAYGYVIKLRAAGHEVEEVDLGVVQPRAPHRDGRVRSVIIPAMEVMRFIYDIDKPSVLIALEPGAPLRAGSWCHWCRAKADCKEHNADRITSIQEGFGPVDIMDTSAPVTIDLPSVSEMTGAQLGNALDLLEILGSYGKLLKQEALARAEIGEVAIPGWVITRTSPHRKWKPDAEATLQMTYEDDEIYERKMKTPAQLESGLGRKQKQEIQGLIYKPEGVLTMAPAKSTYYVVQPKEEIAEGFTATVKEIE